MSKSQTKPIFRYVLLISLHLVFSASAFSQSHTAKTITINANCKGFYEYLPVNYSSSTTNFPLIIYCSGAGSFGNGTASQLAKLLTEGGIPTYINNNQFPSSFTVNGQTSSFIVISPQFVAWPGPADVESVLNYIISSGYKADQSRIYLTGLSAGGDVTFKYPNTSLSRSKRLAAIAPVAAYNSPYTDTGAHYIASANLPVWALHSNDDQSSPVSWSQNFVNKINSYNPPVPAKITRFSGVTHVNSGFYVYTPSFRDGGYNIYEWMLLYRRNYPPVANAGNNTSLTLPGNTVQLNGLSSYDPENSPLTFNWTKISGPAQHSINNPVIGNPVVSNLVAGNYSFKLTVADTNSLFGMDTVTITVINPNPNQLPFARAGTDQQISIPQNAVTLNGTASSDTDGAIESYLWTNIAGPSQFTLTGNTTSVVSVSNLRPGNYLFRLAATDNQGGTGYDTVQVTVINPFPNQLPVAEAGNNVTITLPVNSVNLNGAASSDPDGTIVSYLWSQASGPAPALIVTPGNVTSGFQNLVTGSYQFVLRVTDDSAAIDTDTIAVTVQPAPPLISKFIKVNLFGGTNPYNQGGWNNWNVTGTTNISSSNFNYSDGAASTVNAVLSQSDAVVDNGTSYGGTMCPPEVLRYTTYSTATTRTVTIGGLNNAFLYDLELYASRYSNPNNTTVFVVNGISQSVLTYNNKTSKAVFTNLTPVAGKLVININRPNSYTYMNGLILTERSGGTPPTNQLPISNAGADQAIVLPTSSVTLNGSGSSDPDGSISSYLWAKVGGPSQFNIVNAISAGTVVNNLTPGVYLFELTVTDNGGAIDKDTMQVIVNNNITPPGPGDSLNCGKIFTIVVLGSSTAYGTGSSPVDSSLVNKYLSYVRTKHPLNTIINLATPGLTTYETLCPNGFIPPANRPLPDTIRNITKALSYNPDAIIINLPSNDIAVGFPQQESKDNYERTMTLADAANIPVWVTTTQPRNSLTQTERTYLMEFRDWTYQRFGSKAIDFWTDVANSDGTIVPYYSAGDNIHVNNNGHNLFYLRTVSERILDTLCLRKNNVPIARAGADVSTILPADSAQLNGSTSSDADGSIVSYLWSKISGPVAYSISNASAISPILTGLAAGVYNVELRVTDNYGAIGRDTVKVTVNTPAPTPPVAAAGNDQTIHLPANSVQLNGGSSTDPDGVITGYSWAKISGPASFTMATPAIVSPVVTNLENGVYQVELTVTDNQGLADKDTVIIRVNLPPVANAGNDAAIVLPVNSVQLNGSASSDADGSITARLWSKISGPAQYNFSSNTAVSPLLNNLVNGIYRLELRITDNDGAITRDTVQITVYPSLNTPPVANAGPNIIISLPVNTTTLSGAGSSDANGVITGYQWAQVSGPAIAAIATPNTVSTLISNLQAGVYSFELKVTDDSSATARDTVLITVNTVPPPVITKYIKVNLYGGTSPYNQGGWNNWNVTGTTNIGSSNFNYSDGTASTINAVLSNSVAVVDNGTSYGGTMCPPEVLRFTTYSTVTTRTVTLGGLNNALLYDLELYASRYSNEGNSTVFVVNGISQSISTYSNKTNKAIFTNLSPVAGQLVININRPNSFTYLNGFTLTEKASMTSRMEEGTSTPELITGTEETSEGHAATGVTTSGFPTGQPQSTTAKTEVKKQLKMNKAEDFTVTVVPNASNSDFVLQIASNNAEKILVRIIDVSGREMSITKLNGRIAYTRLGGNLKGGIYFAEVIQGNTRRVVKLIKLN